MQIHELNSFVGTPSAGDYLAIDDGSETTKVEASNLGVTTQMTQAEAEAGTVTESRVVAPSIFKPAVTAIASAISGVFVSMTTPKYTLDTSAASGDDYDLTQALTSLGWLSDVVSSGVLGMKKLLHKMLGMFTPQAYTGYTFSAYTQTEAGSSCVYIVGKLCIFSLSMTYTANYTPTNTQPFIRNMPIPKAPIIMQGITYSGVTTDSSSFRSFRYRINENGEIQNWYSGLKTIANNPTVFSGVYVIA